MLARLVWAGMSTELMWSDHPDFDPYEAFHKNGAGYIGRERNACLTSIDIDALEYCWACYEPVAAIERTRSRRYKPTYLTGITARRMKVPAFLVRYPDTLDNTARFEITQLPKVFNPVPLILPLDQYHNWLWWLRLPHWRNDPCPGAGFALSITPFPPAPLSAGCA